MSRSFADIDAKRKRYNPDVEGYGNAREWTGAFYERMGFEEAEKVLHGQERTPREIVGVAFNATWAEVRSAFRKRALEVHPDRIEITGMTKQEAEEAFKELNAAYAVLAREYGE